jgi:hypothetical protein
VVCFPVAGHYFHIFQTAHLLVFTRYYTMNVKLVKQKFL